MMPVDKAYLCHAEIAGDAGYRTERMEETSRFVRQEGRWLYIDGDVG
jgi:uncharacterized protein YchJ